MFDDKKTRRFNNMTDIKRFLARIINKAKSQELNDNQIKQLRAVIYGCNTLADVIRNHDLELRLERLEENIKGDV